MADDQDPCPAPRRRHLCQLARASRYRRVGRLHWRAGMLTHAWALPLAVLRDYAADCIMVHVLCFAIRIWWTPPVPAGER